MDGKTTGSWFVRFSSRRKKLSTTFEDCQGQAVGLFEKVKGYIASKVRAKLVMFDRQKQDDVADDAVARWWAVSLRERYDQACQTDIVDPEDLPRLVFGAAYRAVLWACNPSTLPFETQRKQGYVDALDGSKALESVNEETNRFRDAMSRVARTALSDIVQEAVNEELSKLSPAAREVTGYVADGLSIRDIAAALGKGKTPTHKHVNRVKEALKPVLDTIKRRADELRGPSRGNRRMTAPPVPKQGYVPYQYRQHPAAYPHHTDIDSYSLALCSALGLEDKQDMREPMLDVQPCTHNGEYVAYRLDAWRETQYHEQFAAYH